MSCGEEGSNCKYQGLSAFGSKGVVSFNKKPQGFYLQDLAFSVFSPYVKWFTIVEAIKKMENIPEATERLISGKYLKLMMKKEHSYEELIRFYQLIQSAELVADSGVQHAIKSVKEKMKTQGLTRLKEIIDKELPIFHTLLHEVGHQFAILHPNDPDNKENTLRLNSEINRFSKVYQTDKSVMSPIKFYLYLTRDDYAAIQLVDRTISEYIFEKSGL